MHFARWPFPRLLSALSIITATTAAEQPAIAADFKLVARYNIGLSNWKSWEYTITADGKVVQHIWARPNDKESKDTTLPKEDISALFAKVKDADFFTLKPAYRGLVTDHPTLILEITSDKKSHTVQLYAHQFLKDKEDQKAADRFLSIWSEVVRKLPAPNKDQKADLYKPGEYRKN